MAYTPSGLPRRGWTTANRPGRPFTSGVTLRPGEQVQIDTNTIDILCRYADGVTRRAELTVAVDVATRSILTGVIAPTTKAADAVAVLARIVVPEPLRAIGRLSGMINAATTVPNGSRISRRDACSRRQPHPLLTSR